MHLQEFKATFAAIKRAQKELAAPPTDRRLSRNIITLACQYGKCHGHDVRKSDVKYVLGMSLGDIIKETTFDPENELVAIKK